MGGSRLIWVGFREGVKRGCSPVVLDPDELIFEGMCLSHVQLYVAMSSRYVIVEHESRISLCMG